LPQIGHLSQSEVALAPARSPRASNFSTRAPSPGPSSTNSKSKHSRP